MKDLYQRKTIKNWKVNSMKLWVSFTTMSESIILEYFYQKLMETHQI